MFKVLKEKIASVRKKQSKSVVLKIDGKEFAEEVSKAVQQAIRDTVREDGCSF